MSDTAIKNIDYVVEAALRLSGEPYGVFKVGTEKLQ